KANILGIVVNDFHPDRFAKKNTRDPRYYYHSYYYDGSKKKNEEDANNTQTASEKASEVASK
ncbi:MAG: hypothetical protein ACI4RO_03915, partial [Candidatus Scatosoma sp.]